MGQLGMRKKGKGMRLHPFSWGWPTSVEEGAVHGFNASQKNVTGRMSMCHTCCCCALRSDPTVQFRESTMNDRALAQGYFRA